MKRSTGSSSVGSRGAVVSPPPPPPPPESKPFSVSDYTKYGLTKEEVLQFKSAFDIFDHMGNGKVQIGELKQAFLNLGFHQQSKFAVSVLNYIERENNGVIDFSEFIRIATAKLNQDYTLPQTTLVFSGFDPKGNGKFNIYDLKDTVRDLGQDLNDDQIQKIFKATDQDNDGYVTTQDFYNIVTKKIVK